MYGKKLKAVDLQERVTLSDIAATIADYFSVDNPRMGRAFGHDMLIALEDFIPS